MRSHLPHAISNLSHLSHEIMQAAPYSRTSSVRTIWNDGCSTTFIVFDVAGEAADEAEEEASTVMPRRIVVVDANRPPSPPPWADAVAGSRSRGGGGGGRDAEGMTQGGANDGAEGGRAAASSRAAAADGCRDVSQECHFRQSPAEREIFCALCVRLCVSDGWVEEEGGAGERNENERIESARSIVWPQGVTWGMSLELTR